MARGTLRHLWTWVQAAGLVYLVGLVVVLLGAAVALAARVVLALISALV